MNYKLSIPDVEWIFQNSKPVNLIVGIYQPLVITLPKTKLAMEHPPFWWYSPVKRHFLSMAMLVYRDRTWLHMELVDVAH